MEYPLIGQSFIYTCAKGCTYILHLLREWVCIFKWLNTSFPGEMPMVLHVGMLFAHLKTPAVTVKHTQWLCRCWKKRVLPRIAILLRTEMSKSKAKVVATFLWVTSASTEAQNDRGDIVFVLIQIIQPRPNTQFFGQTLAISTSFKGFLSTFLKLSIILLKKRKKALPCWGFSFECAEVLFIMS